MRENVQEKLNFGSVLLDICRNDFCKDLSELSANNSVKKQGAPGNQSWDLLHPKRDCYH